MKCNKIQSRFAAFLDGELQEQQQQRIQQHVDSCEHCRHLLEQLKAVDDFLNDGVTLQADPFLITRIKAGVREPGTLKRWFRYTVQRSLVPATVLCGLLIGILIGVKLNTLAMPPETARVEREQPTSKYSLIDPNIYEPVPSGSITATYVSANTTR